MSKKILIIGATSAIAQSTARIYAREKASFVLVGRNNEKLEAVKNDLVARGADQVFIRCADLLDFSSHPDLIDFTLSHIKFIDIAFIAHGYLGEQSSAEKSFKETLHVMEVNLISPISFLTLLGNTFAEQGKGTIAVIGSVAGDRGRQSNYIYGSAKGGLEIFLQGLRNRLKPRGVDVLTIKPGFVDTPMTADIKKNPLFSSPDLIAKDIHRGIKQGTMVSYQPGYWQLIMAIIKMIPEFIFVRLKL